MKAVCIFSQLQSQGLDLGSSSMEVGSRTEELAVPSLTAAINSTKLKEKWFFTCVGVVQLKGCTIRLNFCCLDPLPERETLGSLPSL